MRLLQLSHQKEDESLSLTGDPGEVEPLRLRASCQKRREKEEKKKRKKYEYMYTQ